MNTESINKQKILVEIDAKILQKIDAHRKKKSTATHKISRRAIFEQALHELILREGL